MTGGDNTEETATNEDAGMPASAIEEAYLDEATGVYYSPIYLTPLSVSIAVPENWMVVSNGIDDGAGSLALIPERDADYAGYNQILLFQSGVEDATAESAFQGAVSVQPYGDIDASTGHEVVYGNNAYFSNEGSPGVSNDTDDDGTPYPGPVVYAYDGNMEYRSLYFLVQIDDEKSQADLETILSSFEYK